MNEFNKQEGKEKKAAGFHSTKSYDKLLGEGQSCQNCADDNSDGSHRLPGSFDTSKKGHDNFSTTMPVNQSLTSQPAGPEITSGKYNMETREKTDIKGGNNGRANNNNRYGGAAFPDDGRMAQPHFSHNFGGDQLSPKSQNKGFNHSATGRQNLREAEDDDEEGVNPQNVPRPAHLYDEPLHAGGDVPNYNSSKSSDPKPKSRTLNPDLMKGMHHNEDMPAKLPDPPKTTVPGYPLKMDTTEKNTHHQVDSAPANATESSKSDITPKTTVPGYPLKNDFTTDAPTKTLESNVDAKPETSESRTRAAQSNRKGGHRRNEKEPNLKHVAAPYMPQDTSVPRFGFEGIGLRKKSASGPASPSNEKSFFARRMSFGKSDNKQQDSGITGASEMEGSSDRTRFGSSSSGTGPDSRRGSTGSTGRKSKHKSYSSRRSIIDDQTTGVSPELYPTGGNKIERSLSIGSEDAGVYAKTVGNMPSLIDPSVPTYGHKEVVTETSVYDNDTNGGGYKMHSRDITVGRNVSVGSRGSANYEQATQETPQFKEIHEQEISYSYDPTTVPRSHIQHEGKNMSEPEKKLGVFEKIRRTLSNHNE